MAAALEELRRLQDSRSPNLRFIVDRIRPSIEGVLAGARLRDDALIFDRAVQAKVRRSEDRLRGGSSILEDLIRHHVLRRVGAHYSLATGQVLMREAIPTRYASRRRRTGSASGTLCEPAGQAHDSRAALLGL